MDIRYLFSLKIFEPLRKSLQREGSGGFLGMNNSFSLFLLFMGGCMFIPPLIVISHFRAKNEELCTIKQEMRALETSFPSQNTFLDQEDPFAARAPLTLESFEQESLFLSDEIATLETLVGHPLFQERRDLLERLRFLKGEENHLHWQKIKERSSKGFSKGEKKRLVRPVEVSMEDVAALLSSIEKSHRHASRILGSPLSRIYAFSLLRKKDSSHYMLNMEVLERGPCTPFGKETTK